MSLMEVGRKENEISKAHLALELVNLLGKVLTSDAMHTQKQLSTQLLEGQVSLCFPSKKTRRSCTKIFSPCLLLNIQSLDSKKSRPIFSSPRKSTKVMVVWKFERSKPVKCLIHMPAGRVWHKSIAWIVIQLLEIRRAHWGIETGLHYTAPAVGAGVVGM